MAEIKITGRYQIHAPLGQGGMGIVYQALDRLTGEQVALKRVSLNHKLQVANSAITNQTAGALRLALAREFQTLAGLRHPHIISVLDYGFDAEQQPFFTMTYLPDAKTLLQAGEGLTLTKKIELIEQLLQALAYLHRRGVLHRDLKPENVLVSEGVVRVLDFGLASGPSVESYMQGGTTFYTAPEIWEQASYSPSADLYAVGVIACELLTGQHPFGPFDNGFLDRVLDAEPNLKGLEPKLAAVLQKLLAKDPAHRFQQPEAVLAALAETTGRPGLPESKAIRESFLQAATFVGREQELAQLKGALDQAQQGHGSAWLIGGESGIGKSRLVSELRSQALVTGFQVWQGQALSEGGAPFQLWRGILSWLVLTVPLSDLAASVLKPFVPNVMELLGHPVSDAPALEGKANQDRLCSVVLEALREATAQQPLVLILEDLHWAGPFSRAVLTQVMRNIKGLPVVLITTYRNDEKPNLPDDLPTAHQLILARLRSEQVAHLTSAMVGLSAKQLNPFAQFMYQQTEGNPLFVVEVLRSLATEAGLLHQVNELTLPENLSVAGIQVIIQRRLQRIDPHDYPWLEVAALAGQDLDLTLMRHLDGQMDWPGWLSRCAEAAVLEPQGTGWRFAHDQLRQGVRLKLDAARAQMLHRQIAVGLEEVYAANLTPHLGRLVHHYLQTEQVDKQRWYLTEAAQAAKAAYDLAKAQRYYTQLLPLLAAEAQRDIHLKRGAILILTGKWDEAESDYRIALTLAGTDGSALANAQLALGKLCRQRGDHAMALKWLTQAQANWTAQGDPIGLSQTLIQIGAVFWRKGEYFEARRYSEEGLKLARMYNDPANAALALNNLGLVAWNQGDLATAQGLHEESLAIRRELDDKQGITASLNNLGTVAYSQGRYALARTLYEESLALNRVIGDKQGVAVLLNNLASVQDDPATAQALYEEVLVIMRELGAKQGIATALLNLGYLGLAQRNTEMVYRYCTESLVLAHEMGNQQYLVYNFAGLAAANLRIGYLTDATRLASASETLRLAISMTRELVEQKIYEETITVAQAQLGKKAFDVAWAEGEKLTLDEAVQLALAPRA